MQEFLPPPLPHPPHVDKRSELRRLCIFKESAGTQNGPELPGPHVEMTRKPEHQEVFIPNKRARNLRPFWVARLNSAIYVCKSSFPSPSSSSSCRQEKQTETPWSNTTWPAAEDFPGSNMSKWVVCHCCAIRLQDFTIFLGHVDMRASWSWETAAFHRLLHVHVSFTFNGRAYRQVAAFSCLNSSLIGLKLTELC